MNKIKELREERGYSTRGLEDKLNISYAVINYYENEKRDPSTKALKVLSDFFQVTIDYLLCNNGYCLYAKYENGNFFFKIKDDYYQELKEKKYIYFDNNDNRCINLNALIGMDEEYDIMPLIQEMKRVDSFNDLFEKKVVNDEDLKDLDSDFEQIELTKSFVEMIKDAISVKH